MGGPSAPGPSGAALQAAGAHVEGCQVKQDAPRRMCAQLPNWLVDERSGKGQKRRFGALSGPSVSFNVEFIGPGQYSELRKALV